VLETTGTVADQTLSILIDPGATESFISCAVLKRIKVKAVKQDEFSFVEMASGAKQKVGGKVTGCALNLGEFVTRVNLYVTILGSYDVMIGMDWLELHEAILNCKMKWLSLADDEGQRCVIVGQNWGVSLRFVSSLQLWKSMCKGCNLCDPCAKQKGSSRRSRTPSSGEGVCGRISRGVTWDADGKGIGVYHRPETRDRTDSKNTISDVDPVVTRVENATEGVVGLGTDTS
jgi:hypothetical protein